MHIELHVLVILLVGSANLVKLKPFIFGGILETMT